MNDAASLFSSYSRSCEISVSAEQEEKFRIYSRLLTEWNQKINLTAVTDPEGIAEKHFLDSVLILKYYTPPEGAKVIDVGTGAGFPGIPLKILRPDLKLTLLDSLNKRLVFLDTLLKELNISAELVHTRAEEAARRREYRRQFDFAAARAVASLPVLCEYCLPFLKQGGVFAAMKGPEPEAELKSAEYAVHLLGCELAEKEIYRLPSGDGRSLLLFRRTGPLPAAYPRHGSKIAKAPLQKEKKN